MQLPTRVITNVQKHERMKSSSIRQCVIYIGSMQ